MDSSDDDLLLTEFCDEIDPDSHKIMNSERPCIQSTSSKSHESKPQKHHLDVLMKYFGHTAFRPMQWKIIDSILSCKKDNCAVMATGYGKSLCYQYPAVCENGLSIVISPLISLMEDQVQSLEVSNIPACFLGTSQTKKREVKENLLNGSYRVVYMTPEYASGEVGQELLPELQKSNKIAVLAIDEAHCVSQWGHDFRPAYRGLKILRNLLPNVPILAVTATATETVINDIKKSLNLRDPQILCTGFDRPNLYFRVQKKSSDPYSDISNVLLHERKIFNISQGSVIIYCLTKKITESIALLMKDNGWKCESYHAGLTPNCRKIVHGKFLKDEIKIIVATVAFGMGIDKPNVRCVIHYGIPCDMEGYYQEAGRAGRDGQPSLCVIFHSSSDFVTHSFLREKSMHMSNQYKSHKESQSTYMRQYASSRECRRHFIISYFEKDIKPPTNAQNNCCDNCTKRLTNPKDSSKYEGIDINGNYDFTDDADKFLNVIQYFSPRTYGVGMIVSFLKGSKIKKMDSKYFSHELFGAGSSKTEDWWKQIAFILESEELIKKEKIRMGLNSFPVVVLHHKGEKWLRDKQNNRHKSILLPPSEDIIKYLKVKNVTPLYADEWTSKAKINMTEVESQKQQTLIPETEELDDYAETLLKQLFELRHSLAQNQNVLPHTVASDTALQQMASKRPLSINQLISGKYDGMSISKIEKFGKAFVNSIENYVNGHPQTMKDLIIKHPFTPVNQSVSVTLSMTQKTSVDMFMKGKRVDEIAKERNLAVSTIVSHICTGISTGCNIDLQRLIPAPKLDLIIKIIQSPAIQNDTSRLVPVKKICPHSVTFDDIKISFAYLDVRNHLNKLNIPYLDNFALTYENQSAEYTAITVGLKKLQDSPKDTKDLAVFSCTKKEVLKTCKNSSNCEKPSKYEISSSNSDKPSTFNSSSNIEIDELKFNDDDNLDWGEENIMIDNMDVLDDIMNKSISETDNHRSECTSTKKKSDGNNVSNNNELVSLVSPPSKILSTISPPSKLVSSISPPCNIVSPTSTPSKIVSLISPPSNIVSPISPPSKIVSLISPPSKTNVINLVEDIEDDKEKYKVNQTKRKLPDWMNNVAQKNKCSVRKKMAKTNLFD